MSPGQEGIPALGAGPLGSAARAEVGDRAGVIVAKGIRVGVPGDGAGRVAVGTAVAGTIVAVGAGAIVATGGTVGTISGVAVGPLAAGPQARTVMTATSHSVATSCDRVENPRRLTRVTLTSLSKE